MRVALLFSAVLALSACVALGARHTLDNREIGIHAEVSVSGFVFSPLQPIRTSWAITMRSEVLWGGANATAAQRWVPSSASNRLTRSLAANSVEEVLESRGSTMEHFFSLAEPPSTSSTDLPSVIIYLTTTNISSVTWAKNGVVFSTDDGVVFSYDKLVVIDASGAVLRSSMVFDDSNRVIVLRVEENGIFPLLIDPIIDTPFRWFTGRAITGWIEGSEGEHFGHRVEVFDFDNDGDSDILVSAPTGSYNDGANDRRGKLFYYQNKGTAAGHFTTDETPFLVVEAPNSAGDEEWFGNAMAIVDLDGDAYLDVAAGGFRHSVGALPNPGGDGPLGIPANALRGRQYELFNNGPIPSSTAVKKDLGGAARTVVGWDVTPAHTGNQFLNRYGAAEDDLWWSSPGATTENEGQGKVISGDNIGGHEIWNNPTGGYQDPAIVGNAVSERENDAFFGQALCAGDFDGDGWEDLVITAPRAWSTLGHQGKVHILYGPVRWEKSKGTTTFVYGGAVILLGDQIAAGFGGACMTHDVNNDGRSDLFISSPYFRDTKTNQGRVRMWYGPTGRQASAWTSGGNWEAFGEWEYEGFGYSMASVGDVNNDGYDDFAIGAPFYDDSRGKIYVFNGGPSGPTADYSTAFGPSPRDTFGFSLAGGNINADAYADVVVGGWGHIENLGLNNGTVGRVWVMLGAPLADLEVTFVSYPAEIRAGQQGTYVVEITNEGIEDEPEVVVRFSQTPTTLDLASGSCGSGVTCTCADWGTYIECTILSGVAVGETVTLSVTVDGGFMLGPHPTTATATGQFVDPDGAVDVTTTNVVAIADAIMVDMIVDSNSVEVGQVISYDFLVRIDPSSPDPAVNAVVNVIEIPEWVSVLSFNVSRGSCYGELTCSLGTMYPGETATLHVEIRVSAYPGDDHLEICGRIDSDSQDLVPNNNQKCLWVPVLFLAEISVAVIAIPADPHPGAPLGYSAVLTNAGGSSANNAKLRFTFPTSIGLEIVSIGAAGYTCSVDPWGAFTNVTCDLFTILPGSRAVVSVFLNSDSNIADGTIIDTRLEGWSSTEDPNLSNNVVNHQATLTSWADLSVFAFNDAPGGTVYSDSPLVWTTLVSNNGPSDALSFDTVLTFPAFTVPVSIDLTDAPNTTCTALAQSITCTTTLLVDEASIAIVVNTDVATEAYGIVTSTSDATTVSTYDPFLSSNVATSTANVVSGSDVWLATLEHRPALPCAGEVLSVDFGIVNLGPLDATGVVLNYTVPPKTSVLGGSDRCDPPLNGFVICNVGFIAASWSDSITLVLQLDSDIAPPVTHYAFTTATSPDYFPDNSELSVDMDVCYESSVSLLMLGFPTEVTQEGEVDIIATVTNLGPSQAKDAQVIITLPTFTDISPGSVISPGATCVTSGTPATNVLLTCDIPTIDLNSPWALSFTSLVQGPPLGNITYEGDLTTASLDPFTPDNHAEVVIDVVPAFADLAVFITDTQDPTYAGNPFSQVFTIFNSGTTDAINTTLTVTVDLSVVVSVLSPPECVLVGNVITCDIGDIPENDLTTLLLTVETSPTLGTVFTTEASVTTPVWEKPELLWDNYVNETTTLVQRADLDISLVLGPNPVFGTQSLIATALVTNIGPSVASGTVLNYYLPAFVTHVSVGIGTQGSCVLLVATHVQCSLNDISAGQKLSVSFTATVASTVPPATTLTALANVTLASDDVLANNEDTASVVTGLTTADVRLSINAAPATISRNDDFALALTTTNFGPFEAAQTEVSFDLPVDVTVNGLLPADCVLVAVTVTCSAGSLAVYATKAFNIQLSLASAGTDFSFNITATAMSAVFDPDTANNVDIATVYVVPEYVDLSVFITNLMNPALAGRQFQQVFTLFNTGTATSTDTTLVVNVTDALPGFPIPPSNPAGCTRVGNQITCSLANLPPGGSLSVTLTYGASPTHIGTYPVSAEVSTTYSEPNLANNVASVNVVHRVYGDLKVLTAAAPSNFFVGQ